MPQTKVVRKVESEVPRNVVNHAGRGDNRPAVTKLEDSLYKMPMEELRPSADGKLKGDNWENVLGPEVAARVSAVLGHYPWYQDGNPEHRADCLCAVCKVGRKNAQVVLAKLASPEAIGLRRREHRADLDMSLLEIAEAVETAAAEGSLVLNQAALEKQRIEGYSEQLSGAPQTEDELYRTPAHKLRALANGVFDPLGPQY